MRFLSVFTLLLVTLSSSCIDGVKVATKVEEDALLTVPELIEKNGYPVEVHHVETQDGYILEMHRIPYGRDENAGPADNKPVVFVQHGLLTSSADWIIAGPKKGLGYLLADLGYDVWMGNTRGNTYSRKHTSLPPDSKKFWDFSFHENGVYDLPAMIDYALETTGQSKTFYIGHSQGTTAFFVMCSELPEYNSKIRAQFSLAPMAYMSHVASPLLRFMAQFVGPLSQLLNLLGVNEFLPNAELLPLLGDKMCGESPLTRYLCTNPLFLLCGFNMEQMNTELLAVIMGHTPAGAATKQLIHYGQLINSQNKFRKYDYGSVKNLIKYGQITPPSYKLSEVTAPVALFYGKNDILAVEQDVRKLYAELANPIVLFSVNDDKFSHLDFLWGENVVTLVYDHVFRMMLNY